MIYQKCRRAKARILWVMDRNRCLMLRGLETWCYFFPLKFTVQLVCVALFAVDVIVIFAELRSPVHVSAYKCSENG